MSDDNDDERDVQERHPALIAAIVETPWLILPEALRTIIEVARTGEGPNYRTKAGGIFDAVGVEARAAPVVRDGTAILSIDGPIFPKGNLLTRSSGATSLRALEQEFAAAANDSAIERIILLSDSPGGVSTGVQAFAEQIFAAREKKPVIAVAQDMAASAALWLASAASQFIVTPTARVGSIGVVLRAFRSGTNDDEIEIVSAQSPLKRQDPGSESGRAGLQQWADSMAQVFVETVARNRKVSVDHVLARFGRGATMSGAEAVAAGLADDIGTLEQTIAGFAGKSRSKVMTQVADKPAITREAIVEQHPNIAEAFRKEGHEKGYAEGVKAGADSERTRIKGIEAMAMPGFEKEISEAINKGTSVEATAVSLMAIAKDRGITLGAIKKDGKEVPFVRASDAPAVESKKPRASSIYESRAQAAAKK